MGGGDSQDESDAFQNEAVEGGGGKGGLPEQDVTAMGGAGYTYRWCRIDSPESDAFPNEAVEGGGGNGGLLEQYLTPVGGEYTYRLSRIPIGTPVRFPDQKMTPHMMTGHSVT